MPQTRPLLGQQRPANTDFTPLYTCPSSHDTRLMLLIISNNTAATVTYRVCHDVGGTTYDESNNHAWDKSLAANDNIHIPFEPVGIDLAPGDTIGVRSSSANALTFSLYGEEIERV